MPTRNLNTLFAGWERELLLLIETAPSHQEFWSYWREREEAVEKLAQHGDPVTVDAAYDRLLAIAERGGYVRLATSSERLPMRLQPQGPCEEAEQQLPPERRKSVHKIPNAT